MRALVVAAVLVVTTSAVPSSGDPGPSGPLSAGSPLPTPSASAPDDALERARRAAHEVPFSGTAVVTWHDGGQVHQDELQVQAAGGAVLVDGPGDPVLEMPERHLARGHDDDWALLWSPGFGPSTAVPEMSEKYVTAPGDGAPVVAGRPTDVVEIREDGILRTRLYLDTETGLLLRREQLDESGRLERTVEFRILTLDRSTPAPTVPPKASALLTSQAPSLRPITMESAPEVLGDGFTRLGVYRREAVVQVHYSDGLFELSVFEEAGRLDDDSLPGPGRQVEVGDEDATLYAWPGGHVLVWQAGPVVRTVVSDAPSQELLEAAQALPGPGWGRPSLLDKIRRAGAALVDPIT